MNISISPTIAGLGATVLAGVGSALAVTKLNDSIVAKHPERSRAEVPVMATSIGAAFAGALLASGGAGVLTRGNPMLGAGLIGAGIGTAIGSFGAGLAFGAGRAA